MKNIDIYKSISKEDLVKKYANSPSLNKEKKDKMIGVISIFVSLFKKKHII
jgi:hypothetical protein